MIDLKQYIRDIPDFPIPGIIFRDITPLMQDPSAFRHAVDRLHDAVAGLEIDIVMPVEARGFLFGAPLAYKMSKPLVPCRKEGKLPASTYDVRYSLEYGEATVEVHRDGIEPGQRVLIVDDLLATGGTVEASARLVEKAGGQVAGLAVLVELADLGGRARLGSYPIMVLIEY